MITLYKTKNQYKLDVKVGEFTELNLNDLFFVWEAMGFDIKELNICLSDLKYNNNTKAHFGINANFLFSEMGMVNA